MNTDSEWFIPPAPELPGATRRGQEMDARLGVRFGPHAVLDETKSAEEGRPIFTEKDYVMIHFPGDRLSIIHREVRPSDAQRFPLQWAAYKANGKDALVGTPLDKCPVLTSADVAELRYFNVRTCEEFVQMSDGNATKFASVRAQQQKVRDFLDAAKGAAHTSQVRAELEKRDAEVASLKAALDQQGEKLNQLLAALSKQAEASNSNQEQPQHKRK